MALLGAISWGVAASVLLLGVFFGVVTLVSGWSFTLSQFAAYWVFLVPLALGFGAQVGLFAYLRRLVGRHGTSGKVVAASGTTSTAAMISCCSHYLVNLLPILGFTGFITVVAEYQIQLFWVGLALNLCGLIYIGLQVMKAAEEHRRCLTDV